MTGVALHDPHAVHAEPAPPPTGFRRLLAAGWLRVPWMTALFFGIGAGIVCLVRWLEGWHPIWKGSIITTVEMLRKLTTRLPSGSSATVLPWVHSARDSAAYVMRSCSGSRWSQARHSQTTSPAVVISTR